MKLVYINKVGKNWENEFIYEFIFSEHDEKTSDLKIDGDEWDSYPANGEPAPPHKEFINLVGVLVSTINFDLLQDSKIFSFWDGVDGLVGLAWENIEGYEEYPDSRLYFHFGDTKNKVESKLYEKDLIINYKKEYLKIEK